MAHKNYPYYYRKGEIMTTKELFRPTPEHLTTLGNIIQYNPLFDGFSVIGCGSLTQGVSSPPDMDILVYGALYDSCLVYKMLYEISRIGIVELNVNTDVLFTTDISFLTTDISLQQSKSYDVYTHYNFEMEIRDNVITKFRNFNSNERVGLLTKHKTTQPSLKAIERNYKPNQHIFLR